MEASHFALLDQLSHLFQIDLQPVARIIFAGITLEAGSDAGVVPVARRPAKAVFAGVKGRGRGNRLVGNTCDRELYRRQLAMKPAADSQDNAVQRQKCAGSVFGDFSDAVASPSAPPIPIAQTKTSSACICRSPRSVAHH